MAGLPIANFYVFFNFFTKLYQKPLLLLFLRWHNQNASYMMLKTFCLPLSCSVHEFATTELLKQCFFTKSVTKGKIVLMVKFKTLIPTFVRLGYLIAVKTSTWFFSSYAVDFSAKAILVSLKIDIYNYLTPKFNDCYAITKI